jgi:hypothetical protein
MKKYEMLEMRTGLDFSKRSGLPNNLSKPVLISDVRDNEKNYWNAVDSILRTEEMDEALHTVELANDFLIEIVHLSYYGKEGVDKKERYRVSEFLSIADLGSKALPREELRIIDTIAPIRILQLNSKDLVLQKPKTAKNKSMLTLEEKIQSGGGSSLDGLVESVRNLKKKRKPVETKTGLDKIKKKQAIEIKPSTKTPERSLVERLNDLKNLNPLADAEFS